MIPYTLPITANGIYTIEAKFVGSDYVLYASGIFGTATVTFGYIDGSNIFTSYKNVDDTILTTTSSSGYIFTAPPSKLLAVSVSGVTIPSGIRLDITHRKG